MKNGVYERGIIHCGAVGFRGERIIPAQRGGVLIKKEVAGQRDGADFPDEFIAAGSLPGVGQLKISEAFTVGEELSLSG